MGIATLRKSFVLSDYLRIAKVDPALWELQPLPGEPERFLVVNCRSRSRVMGIATRLTYRQSFWYQSNCKSRSRV